MIVVCALWYVVGICSSVVVAVGVPELVVRLNWWLTDGGNR